MSKPFYVIIDQCYEDHSASSFDTEAQAERAANQAILQRGAREVIVLQKVSVFERTVKKV